MKEDGRESRQPASECLPQNMDDADAVHPPDDFWRHLKVSRDLSIDARKRGALLTPPSGAKFRVARFETGNRGSSAAQYSRVRV